MRETIKRIKKWFIRRSLRSIEGDMNEILQYLDSLMDRVECEASRGRLVLVRGDIIRATKGIDKIIHIEKGV